MAQRKKGTSIQPYIHVEDNSDIDEPSVSDTFPSSQHVSNIGSESAPLLIHTPVDLSSSHQRYGSIRPSTSWSIRDNIPSRRISLPSSSWSTREGHHPSAIENRPTRISQPSFARDANVPYTRENRPNRRPFHLGPARRISIENDAQLYSRFRYYSRLRGPAFSNDEALVIPDHVLPTEFFLPYVPGQLKDVDGKQASYVTVIAIWNTMMGTSLLTMPWAFGQAGFAGGFLIMLLMGFLCLYTAYRMLTLQRTMGMDGDLHEFGYLCRYLWGGSLGKAIEGTAVTFSVVTLLGAQVVYWVLMSNFLYNTGEAIHTAVVSSGVADNGTDLVELICPSNTTTSLVKSMVEDDTFSRFWKQDLSVPLILVIPFIFLLSIKDPAIFTYFNSFGAISVVAMYIFVITKASSWGFNFTLTDQTDPLFVPLFKGTFMALSGTLSLAYFIHNCIITIMKGNRNPENNVRDLSLAYMMVALTYIPIGVVFYLSFPLDKFCVSDNFLDNFPPHNVILAIVRGFLLFQMLTVFPLLTCFIRAQLLTYFLGPGIPHKWYQIIAINAFTLVICVLVSIFYPNIGFIIRWIGAISGLAYIFVLPCVSYMQALYCKESLTWTQLVPHSIIIVLGLANFAAQFFLS